MSIVRIFKIKCEDGKELEIHEPLTRVGKVSITISDENGSMITRTEIDVDTWNELIRGMS